MFENQCLTVFLFPSLHVVLSLRDAPKSVLVKQNGGGGTSSSKGGGGGNGGVHCLILYLVSRAYERGV